MYRNQAWFDALEFSYDMSVPNVAHLEPQRGGCCTVMPYFIGDLVELPLTTIQDYSLFHILGDYSTDDLEEADRPDSRTARADHRVDPSGLSDREARARGVCASCSTHLQRPARPTGMSGSRCRAMWTLVAQPQRDDAGRAAADRWRDRGPDSDRARVAYATLDDGGWSTRSNTDRHARIAS